MRQANEPTLALAYTHLHDVISLGDKSGSCVNLTLKIARETIAWCSWTCISDFGQVTLLLSASFDLPIEAPTERGILLWEIKTCA